MRTLQGKLFRYCTIAICAAVVANGCMLDRRPILSPGTVVPRQYCPGDTLVASYDFLRFTDGVCTPRAGSPGECATAAPTATMTATPALFPPTTLQSYQNSVSFTAAGDRVDVGFVYGASSIFVPPSRLLVNVRDHTVSATRIVGAVETSLQHMGNCPTGFAMPTYAPVEVPGPPRASANMRIIELVNVNSVPVTFTLGGSPSGMPYSSMVAAGGTLRTDMPGAPGDAGAARMISIAPMGLICGPGGDGITKPQPVAPQINTLVRTGCR